MGSIADLVSSIFAPKPQQEPLGSGLNMAQGGPGLAPYGLRHTSGMPKGHGYFGPMKSRGGISTELSREETFGGKPFEYPLMVPGMTGEQLGILTGGGTPTPEMEDMAYRHAASRVAEGKSPFAGPSDLRLPKPDYFDPLILQSKYRAFQAGVGPPLNSDESNALYDYFQNQINERSRARKLRTIQHPIVNAVTDMMRGQ